MSTEYIAGPMSGKPKLNFPLFDEIAEARRRKGHTVINPADHDRDVALANGVDAETADGFVVGNVDIYHAAIGTTRDALMGWDLVKIIQDCDGIILIPGWEHSGGAGHEKYVAEATGKYVLYAYRTLQGHWLFLSHDRYAEERANSINARIVSYGDLKIKDKPSSGSVTIIQGHQYGTKDSGVREEYASGMVRDTVAGKPRYDLIPTMPLRRLAELYARGAEKYGECNWQLANSEAEHRRFRASAMRHMQQWLEGDEEEDHAIAVVWNIFAFLWLEEKIGPLPELGSPQVEPIRPPLPVETREGWDVVADQPFRRGDIVTPKRGDGSSGTYQGDGTLRGTVVHSGIERTLVEWDGLGALSEQTRDLKVVK